MARELLQTGATIDGFLIGEKIHVGGMAELWSVTRPDIDVPLLMKAPLILDGEDAEAIVGFEMEQMILPMLTGPHAPRFFAAGDFASQPYIVMERLPGHSLFPRIEDAPLPTAEIADLGARIAHGLADLHAQNVVHLDIKPSNVIHKPDGDIAFVDFGLSRHLHLPDLLAEEFRLPMGTGPYMAPEQLFRIRDDRRSDIFALGVLLYHLAVGVRPFGFPRNGRALRRRLWKDPVPPVKLVPGFPPWLQEIILRCLEVRPEDRYPNAEQLAFDLRHADQVELGPRARRAATDGLFTRAKRFFAAAGYERATFAQRTQAQTPHAPIIMAAVDLTPGGEALAAELRRIVGEKIASFPEARLACVNVLKQNRVQLNYALDAEGRNLHVQRLVELKDWARPLGLAQTRLTFHVLEAPDPAAALLGYARENDVDQILLGARASSTLRRYLGSVSAQIVAEAPCTVTVVRLKQLRGEVESPVPSEPAQA
ncbi:MAG: protein kinase [Methylobacteriaceae bacterium]|nr:protein kinase [Methylobacteriaceae bacterium]